MTFQKISTFYLQVCLYKRAFLSTKIAETTALYFGIDDIGNVIGIPYQGELNIKEITIEIYNLENYLLDLEKSSSDLIQKVNFFPPYPLFEKNDVHVEDFKIEPLENKKIKRIINEKVKSVQRFCKGVIWLVTSDTLPSEENSW